MLQTIRDNSKGVIAGILVGFLVIIFALSGAESLFTGSTRSGEVAEVNGEPITENDVLREIQRQRRQIQNQYGDSVPSEFTSDERLRGPAIDNLIQRQVMVQSARNNGMSISEATLDALILDTPAFQTEDGGFDADRYRLALRSMGYTPAQYKRVLANEMLMNQMALGLAGSSFVTERELSELVALNAQKRSFDYMVIDADSLAGEVEVSDADIEAYYQNNQQEFTQPEQVAVDYIELSVDGLMDQVDIDEEAIRKQFEQNRDQAQDAVQKRVAHILIEEGDQETLDQAQEALSRGESFEEVARQYSDDLGSREQGGDLGFVSADVFPAPFQAALENLSPGEVSGPVETEAGVHLIKVLDEQGSGVETFEQARDRIASQLKRVEAENQFVTLMERLSELSYNAEDLKTVAGELGLELGNTGLFSKNGGEGLAANRQVVEAAFSEEVLERGNSSHLLELANDRVVVVKKTDYREAYVRPLAEVSDQIRQRLEARQLDRLLAERGEALLEELRSGQSMEELAERAGLELKEVEAAQRGESGLPRALVNQVFAMPRSAVSGNQSSVSGARISEGYALIQLKGVEDGDLASLSQEERQALQQNLERMQGQREYQAYRDLLVQSADIER